MMAFLNEPAIICRILFSIWSKLVGVARAQFCRYFTPPIPIPLIPEEDKFSNATHFLVKKISVDSISSWNV